MYRLPLALLLAAPLAARAQQPPVLMLDSGGHTAQVHKALFTPDGKEVISVSDDKTIRVWDAATGLPVRVLRPHVGYGPTGMLYAAALSPDGQTLAVGGSVWKYGVYLISLPRGKIDRVLTGHLDVVRSLAFTADGQRLVSGADNAKVWDVATGQCLQTLRGHTKPLFGVAWSPDGKRVVTGSGDGTARIWDAGTGESLAVLQGHADVVRCVAWSPDGRTVATAGLDKSLRLWDAGGTFRHVFQSAKSWFTSLTFTPDSQEILLTRNGPDSDYVCSLLNPATGTERVRFRGHRSTVVFGSLSRDGALAVTCGGTDNEIYVWRTNSAQPVARSASQGRRKCSAGWGPDGRTVAWSNDYQPGADLFTATNPIDHSFDLASLEWGGAPDNRFARAQVAVGGLTLEQSGRLTVAVKQGDAVRATLTVPDHAPDQDVSCFTFLPGNRVAVGCAYGLYLFDALTGKPAPGLEDAELQGHTGNIWAVAPSPDGRYLLSASQDQTLRVWNLKSRNPLLSLFVAGNEWIAWTHEGYYAASPGGDRLMGWQINRGRNEFGEFHPAVRFRKELYRPDVIRRLLAAGSVETALAEADRAAGRVSRPVTVEQIPPPKVELEAPADGSDVTVTAVAESRGDQPVTAMRLLVDGQQVDGKAGVRRFDQPKAGEARATWQVQLPPGKHRLQVLADSSVSQGGSDEVTVTNKGGTTTLRPPRLVVLAIGISKYRSASVGALDYAASDARAAAEALAANGRGLFREVKTKLLTDGEATRDNVMDALEWLSKEVTPDDYAVVFFAGHGELDNVGNVYFLPVDADKDKLRRTAVAGEELMKSYRDLPPSKRVLILDACHAGAISTGKRRSSGSVTDNLVRDLLTPENGVVVMCSATGREFAQESHQHQMGVFTLALTEGLAGKGPKDASGLVFTHHLHSYVCDRVKELTGGQQHPVMKNPDEIRSFPVAKP